MPANAIGFGKASGGHSVALPPNAIPANVMARAQGAEADIPTLTGDQWRLLNQALAAYGRGG